MSQRVSIQHIADCLPHTQCTACGYGGCMPYATAIASGSADINRCQPGGMRVMKRLAQVMGVDAEGKTLLNAEKPQSVVTIDAAKCVGCSLCMKACPVDAIVGALKQEHVVLADDCTGCELCIAPCPTECISVQVLAEQTDIADDVFYTQAFENRKHYDAKQARLADVRRRKITDRQSKVSGNDVQGSKRKIASDKLAMIMAARAKAKAKMQK